MRIVRQYTDIRELMYENDHEFIDRILIHEPDYETETRKVEIFYSFVGQIINDGEPTENTSYQRRGLRYVKSIIAQFRQNVNDFQTITNRSLQMRSVSRYTCGV